MKGLELAKAYFTEYGLPMLEKFGSVKDRAACGMVGPGSECFGFDDELSRDHDWGPGFCIWLTDEDFETYGTELETCYGALPKEFAGFGPRIASNGEEHRVGVESVTRFYKRYTGLARTPETQEEWDRISEQNLALCTNGRVFLDPLGDFTLRRKELLAYYPEPVRRKKIARTLFMAGQGGQYNLQRSIAREDPYQTVWAEQVFGTAALKLAFIFNRRFAPYDKWLLRGAMELPFPGPEIVEQVDKMLRTADPEKKFRAAAKTCSIIIDRLDRLAEQEGPNTGNSRFLIERAMTL